MSEKTVRRAPTLRKDLARYDKSDLPDDFFVRDATPDVPPPYASFRGVVAQERPGSQPDETTIVFRCSEGKRMVLSRNDVEAHTGALIPENWRPRSVVDLPEPSAILVVLFRFIGPRRHPDLRDDTFMNFDVLAWLTKAAEKYKVFSAMNICSDRMRSFCDRYPSQVLLYAAHNNYPRVFDDAAFHVLTSQNLEDILPLLPEGYRLKWVKYHGRVLKALGKIALYPSKQQRPWGFFGSGCWESCGQTILASLSEGVHALNDLSKLFQGQVAGHIGSCKKCEALCNGWKSEAETEIAQAVVFSAAVNEA